MESSDWYHGNRHRPEGQTKVWLRGSMMPFWNGSVRIAASEAKADDAIEPLGSYLHIMDKDRTATVFNFFHQDTIEEQDLPQSDITTESGTPITLQRSRKAI